MVLAIPAWKDSILKLMKTDLKYAITVDKIVYSAKMVTNAFNAKLTISSSKLETLAIV